MLNVRDCGRGENAKHQTCLSQPQPHPKRETSSIFGNPIIVSEGGDGSPRALKNEGCDCSFLLVLWPKEFNTGGHKWFRVRSRGYLAIGVFSGAQFSMCWLEAASRRLRFPKTLGCTLGQAAESQSRLGKEYGEQEVPDSLQGRPPLTCSYVLQIESAVWIF